MRSYYIPRSVSPRNSNHGENLNGDLTPILHRSRSSGQSSQESVLFPSPEQGRGTPVSSVPSFLRRPGPLHQDVPIYRVELPEPGRYPILAKYEQPMEVRRRIPGCGINHFDPFSSPVAAERSPLQPKAAVFDHSAFENLFDQFDSDSSPEAMFGRQKFVQEHFQRKTYGRPIAQQPQLPKKWHPGTAPILTSSEQILASTQSQQALLRQRQVSDIRYPYLGPVNPQFTSSSSSSDSPPSSIRSFSSFEPLDASSFNRTPPQKPISSQIGWRHPSNRVYSSPSQGTDELSQAPSGLSSPEGECLPESPIPGSSTSSILERPTPHTW